MLQSVTPYLIELGFGIRLGIGLGLELGLGLALGELVQESSRNESIRIIGYNLWLERKTI